MTGLCPSGWSALEVSVGNVVDKVRFDVLDEPLLTAFLHREARSG